MYRSVLLPLDGSPASEQAVQLAASLVKRTGGQIELVHIHEPNPPDAWLPVTPFHYEGLEQSDREWQGRDVARETEYLSQFTDRLDGVARYKVLQGAVVPALEREIEETNPDLIMMSAGNVAEVLVRDVHRPVILIHPQNKPVTELRTDHIMIPLDGSRHGESVIKHALELSDASSRLTLLTVAISAENVEAAYDYLDLVAEELRAEGHTVTCDVIVSSSEANAILLHAAEHNVDVICMATHGRNAVRRLLMGSVANEVLRGAKIPVLLYRP